MSGYAANSKSFVESFINEHITRHGLDYRTEKAYRLDLEHFCAWMEQEEEHDCLSGDNSDIGSDDGSENGAEYAVEERGGQEIAEERVATAGEQAEKKQLEDWMESYLNHLAVDRKLSASTVCRKTKVFSYYLEYLVGHGVLAECRSLQPAGVKEKRPQERESLSKKESDAFFAAMNREYEELDSEFRRRVCLRDMVMMELLFYHKIEISELLRLEVSDYEENTGILTIRRKRGGNVRIYVFSQGLRRKLGEWLVEREEFRRDGEYSGRMFLSKFGKPLSMKMVIKIFEKYREMAGIEKEFTPKDLKESCMKQYARELVMERCR